jgi:hypothetical protein
VTTNQPKQATSHTQMHNRNAADRDFDPADLARVRKGFIAKRENGLITDE